MAKPPDGERCAICQLEFQHPVVQSNCNHWFCGGCIIDLWVNRPPIEFLPCKCPRDRHLITSLTHYEDETQPENTPPETSSEPAPNQPSTSTTPSGQLPLLRPCDFPQNHQLPRLKRSVFPLPRNFGLPTSPAARAAQEKQYKKRVLKSLQHYNHLFNPRSCRLLQLILGFPLIRQKLERTPSIQRRRNFLFWVEAIIYWFGHFSCLERRLLRAELE